MTTIIPPSFKCNFKYYSFFSKFYFIFFLNARADDEFSLSKDEFTNKSMELFIQNKAALVEGDNNWLGTINSKPVTFRINVGDGVARNFNAYSGFTNRKVDIIFKYGNQIWK